jgi:vancomycin permeability regulator SanA
MRYLIAMIAAALMAALAMFFASSRIASWVVSKFVFENPDQVADLHVAVFMGMNVAALVVGWIIGWVIGGKLVGADESDE